MLTFLIPFYIIRLFKLSLFIMKEIENSENKTVVKKKINDELK